MTKRTERPDWHTYFIQIAKLVSTRSTCIRRKVGAVLVKENRILSTGYNGAPQGLTHCLEIGCLREEMGIESGKQHELCRGLHAEQNAIIQAARYGISTRGAICYTTTSPCIICMKMLIQAGVKKIITIESYPDDLAEIMRKESGIAIEFIQAKEQ